MALFGLFGKKDKKDDSANEKTEFAYFLDQDSAKTFGDIDYMRTPKAVRKTFPTMNGVKGAEITEIVSANEKGEGFEVNIAASNASTSTPQSTFELKINTRVDSSMDIFLNMAKDIKKK